MKASQSNTSRSLFQTIDYKENCKSKFYSLEEIIDDIPEGQELITWKYNRHIKDPENHDYAFIWAQGSDLDDLCPEDMKKQFDAMQKRFLAFHISFQEAKLDKDEICFYDTLPVKFLKDWCEMKNQICREVIKNPKPENYEFQKKLSFLIEKIKNRTLNLDWSQLNKASKKTPALLKIKNNDRNRIVYNQYGTATGRLSTNFDSFPILTIDKLNRTIIKPKNDLFLELDYNAAELRTLLSITDKEQPDIDLHSWINSEIYKNKYSRQDVKQKVFAWLYNANANNKRLNNLFERDKIIDEFYDGKSVKTPFGRTLEVDKRKAVNYLIQSTTSDIVLRQALKIDDYLKDTKSFISFVMHDSIIIDISRDQQADVSKLVSIFSQTDLGNYKVNISLGKNYGTMKRVE